VTGDIKRTFKFRDTATLKTFLGPDRSTIRLLRRLHVRAQVQGKKIVLKGSSPQDMSLASDLVMFVSMRAHQGQETRPEVADAYMKNQTRHSTPNSIDPKTDGQAKYLSLLAKNDVVFGIGPAGTGKTFLAVATGLQHLRAKKVERLILTRPAVEAGEKLGYLPGTFAEKVDPYLQPLADSLNKLMGKGIVERMKKDGRIEIAPLAYMRGRTLEDAYVIVDEAQNCTWKQLVMVLTRLGEGSKAVLTGDISQTDLYQSQSGLKDIVGALGHIEGIGVHEFGVVDVVRHPLVARIVEALADRGSVTPIKAVP
jgi:phosphate starvation-inducible protein PhoH and related proteins